MKKLIASCLTALFLTAVSAPVFAADTTPVKTPVAKSMKHKKTWHKRPRKAKKGTTASTTPTTK